MRKIVCLFLCLSLLASGVFAQNNRTVTGTVRDEKGVGLPNISIVVKGTNVGTTTLTDGSFSIKVSENAKTLVITSVGFGTQEVSISKSSTLTINLQSTSSNLYEVLLLVINRLREKILLLQLEKLAVIKLTIYPFQTLHKLYKDGLLELLLLQLMVYLGVR